MLNMKLLYGILFQHGSKLYYPNSRMLHQQHRKQINKYSEYFQTLGLPEDASKSSVRQKYIELVKKYHPDACDDGGEKFNAIDTAYKKLMLKFQEDKIR